MDDAETRAAEAIDLLVGIISDQFGAFGDHPWFCSVPGVVFIKKEYESNPFIRLAYLPNCALVGPEHKLTTDPGSGVWVVHDPTEYEDREIADEEFLRRYQEANTGQQPRRDT